MQPESIPLAPTEHVNDDLVSFVWLLNTRTGQVVHVNHRAHINRLMLEGAQVLTDGQAAIELERQMARQRDVRTPVAPEPIVAVVGNMQFTQSQLDQLRTALGVTN